MRTRIRISTMTISLRCSQLKLRLLLPIIRGYKQCFGSALVSMRIRILIQLFTSMRIRIRVQGAKPMLNHADPDSCQTLLSQTVDFYMKNILYPESIVICHRTYIISSHIFRIIFLFWSIFFSWILILIPMPNTDPDPRHWVG